MECKQTLMTADQRPVQFGIIGAGRIARNAFAPALAKATGAELAAVASRDLGRAKSLKPERAYDGYEALLDDPDVDAVYVATHNGLHRELTIAALERGKHVLCEKPLACNAAECAEMVAAARQHRRHLVEAFMYRFHPRIAAAKAKVDTGEIGEVKCVEAAFSFRLSNDTDIRWNAAWGGGSLLDVGCYCVNACRFFLDGMPRTVTTFATFHPVHDVDVSLHGVLDFDDGRYGVVSCGFDAGFRDRVLVCGTEGTLTLPLAFCSSRVPTKLITGDVDESPREQAFDPVDTFQLEIEDFAHAIRTGTTPLLEPEEGLRNALVMEALLRSARAGGAPTAIEKT
jgi:xylose dehydrogenase (NAD/NADP)